MEEFIGKKLLLSILDKSPDAITEAERDVLRARESYLTKEEKEKFGVVKEEKPAKVKKSSKK